MHTVGEERIAIVVGRERRSSERPNSLIIFLHRSRFGTFEREFDLIGVGGAETERYRVVGMNLRRNEWNGC